MEKNPTANFDKILPQCPIDRGHASNRHATIQCNVPTSNEFIWLSTINYLIKKQKVDLYVRILLARSRTQNLNFCLSFVGCTYLFITIFFLCALASARLLSSMISLSLLPSIIHVQYRLYCPLLLIVSFECCCDGKYPQSVAILLFATFPTQFFTTWPAANISCDFFLSLSLSDTGPYLVRYFKLGRPNKLGQGPSKKLR